MSTLSPARHEPDTGGLDAFELAIPGWQADAHRTHVTAAGPAGLRTGDFTHLYLGLVHDHGLRETLRTFERVLEPVRPFAVTFARPAAGRAIRSSIVLRAAPTTFGQSAALANTAEARAVEPDAVTAVGWVGSACGVPVVDVLAAAGIRERTFHEWKTNGRQPRLHSQGRLWAVHQAVQDLVSDLDGEDALRRWMLADPARRELFRAGDLQRLRAAAAPAGPATTGLSPAAVAALGDDVEPGTRPGVDRGRTTPVRGNPTRRGTRASSGPRRE